MNLIFDDETIIGFAFDVIKYAKSEIEDTDDEMLIESMRELIEEVEPHDELVECWHHPMGTWHVSDLVRA